MAPSEIPADDEPELGFLNDDDNWDDDYYPDEDDEPEDEDSEDDE